MIRQYHNTILFLYVAFLTFALGVFGIVLPAHGETSCYRFTRNFGLGSEGQFVLELQKILNGSPDTQVATIGVGSPGNETLYFGNRTFDAVIKFQNKYPADILVPNGLSRGNGYVGASTRAKLENVCASRLAEIQTPALQGTQTITRPNNQRPIFDFIQYQDAYVGYPINVNFRAVDPNKDTLVYTVTSALPLGATFSTTTRFLTWTPQIGQGGENRITIEASDGELKDAMTIVINVGGDPTYRPPVAVVTPITPIPLTPTVPIIPTPVIPSIPPPPTIPLSTASITINSVGTVKADGITNDAPAIQKIIDDAAPGTTIIFEAGKTYLLRKALIVQKSLTLDGQGATLLCDSCPHPYNNHIIVESATSSPSGTWTDQVGAGQNTFPVSIPGLAVGDNVLVSLGQDKYDKNEDHFVTVAQVTANSGSSISVDMPTPYAINFNPNDTNFRVRKHKIEKISSLAEYVTVKNFNLIATSRTIIDSAIWFERTKNSSVENITGKFPTGVHFNDSRNITVRNITGEIDHIHQSDGRILSGWQNDNMNASNLTVTTATYTPVVFLESWNRNITIRDLTVNWNVPESSTSGHSVLFFTGGSSGIYADNITIKNLLPVLLVGHGGDPKSASYKLGRVTMTGGATSADATFIDDLTVSGKHYRQADKKTEHFEFTLNAVNQVYTFPLSRGFYYKYSIKPSSLTGINSIYMLNDNGQGINHFEAIKNGTYTFTEGRLGSIYPFNSVAGKKLVMNVGAITPGTKIVVDVEYIPEAMSLSRQFLAAILEAFQTAIDSIRAILETVF